MIGSGDIEKCKRFIIRFAYWLIIACIVYFFIKYLLPVLMPFVLGWIFAAALKPLTDKTAKLLKLRYKWASVIALLVFYLALTALIALSGVKMFGMLSDFILAIPEYYASIIVPAFWRLVDLLTRFVESFNPAVLGTVEDISTGIISSLTNLVMSFSASAFNKLTAFIASLPMFLINFMIVLISSFYIAADYPRIQSFLLKQLKRDTLSFIALIKNNTVKVMGKFLKAYLLLMAVMFVEMLIGMYLIGVSNPVFAAMGIAVFDIFPVLGTGGILVPWALIDLIMGNVTRAAQVLLLYAIVSVVRNFMEPKVVGSHIGLHPLMTLILMYVGAVVFGFGGFLILPLAGVIIMDMNDSGAINLYKK